MATNYTTNYQLNQWEPTDQVLRTDFNADNAKIDAALKGLRDIIISGDLLLQVFDQYDQQSSSLENRIQAIENQISG